MTSYALRSASPARTKADAVVVGVRPGEGSGGRPSLAEGAEDVAAAYGRKLTSLLGTLGVTGAAGEIVKVPTQGTLGSPVLHLVGLGKDDSVVALRRAAGAAARAVSNAASVALALPADTPERVRAVTEGFLLGGYTFTAYKSSTRSTAPAEVAVLSPAARQAEAKQAFAEAQTIATATARTRDWVNTPPNDLTPPLFAERVEQVLAERGRDAAPITVTVHDEEQLAALGCGGILSVGRSSAAPPRLVTLEYAPPGAVAHLALVGKGITFDSGGLSIKPGGSMTTMKSDMAGAAAVVHATLAIAELGLPVRVSTWAALAENMVSGRASRPGDVVTMYGGTTVELANTDAEGRMVLGDALVMAAEAEPDLIVDVATLTGHMVMALGDRLSGLLGTDDAVDLVRRAGEVAGEEHWPMPIPPVMSERIRSSTVADLSQHDWIRWGGGLFAAAFLREFTGGRPWAHLDIAGPSFVSAPTGHWTAGGTGVTVSTLVELARLMADGSDGA
ncbi:leucyl aminopeptidase [Nocardioides sp.]|uniref:leucyl aminopeptidase n=1 Tax=Nocardioides sp. TaxID=35761 RepID=UPI003511CF69